MRFAKAGLFLILSLLFLVAGCEPAFTSISDNASLKEEAPSVSIPSLGALLPNTKIVPIETPPPSKPFLTEDLMPLSEPEEHLFFGTWRFECIVLESYDYEELRHGIKNFGGRRYYEEDYLGYEVEYSSNYYRFGDRVVINPEYILYDFLLYDYIVNGSFHFSDFHAFIEKYGISIDRAGEYESIDDIPLTYFVVRIDDYAEYYTDEGFAPLGMGCILLNKDTMLVGAWGKIILALRVA
jgi:hypothetical protein